MKMKKTLSLLLASALSLSLLADSCAELFFILDGHGYFRTLYEEFPISVQDLLIVERGWSVFCRRKRLSSTRREIR